MENSSQRSIPFSLFFLGLIFVAWASVSFFTGVNPMTAKSFKVNEPADSVIKSSDSDDSTEFTLSSSAFNDFDFFPDDYVCTSDLVQPLMNHGPQNNPPLEWSNAPDGTVEYLLTMHSHILTLTDNWVKFDWSLYNIDADITSIDTFIQTGDNDIITGGTYNQDGGDMYDPFYFYNSPCSTGPGQKNYTFTLWALSGSLYDLLAAEHGRTYLTDDDMIDNTTTKANQLLDLANANNLVIGNATLHVYYTRYKVILT